MKLWLRIIAYLGGGGMVVIWANPAPGLAQHLLILALIVGFAYLDRWMFKHSPSGAEQRNVVSLKSVRQTRSRRHGAGGAGREKRVFQTVFSSPTRHEVDHLLSLLRGEDLNPMMVSQKTTRGDSGTVYEVRLPEKEMVRAKPLIQFFLVKTAKSTS